MKASLLFFCLVSITLIASAAQITSNYSRQYANVTINHAIEYVNMVNESSYLLFYPNLTQAYSYLNTSLSLYNSSPADAVVFANKAVGQAMLQYNVINSYRQVSAAAMLLLTLLLLLLLHRLMAPVRKARGARR